MSCLVPCADEADAARQGGHAVVHDAPSHPHVVHPLFREAQVLLRVEGEDVTPRLPKMALRRAECGANVSRALCEFAQSDAAMGALRCFTAIDASSSDAQYL